jgi:hypothetical protein
MNVGMKWIGLAACAGILTAGALEAKAEVCTTQSAMAAADREALAAVSANMATKIQADDEAGLRSETIAEFQKDFSGIARTIGSTAPKLKGMQPDVDQVYLLDASSLKPGPGGVNPDAQFFCTLNRSSDEAEFSIPQLPPGKYAFAMVRMEGANPWLVSLLLRQDGGKWMLAGLYPKPTTADGHDGVWYWKQARVMQTQQQPWDAWLYLQEAQALVQPAGFVSSTHLEKLQSEILSAVPPALSNGISMDTPLVVKGANGIEYRFTGLSVDDSLGLDVAAHLKVDSLDDAAAARKRNIDAMEALLTAHPELRKAFHGVWIFAEAPGKSPYATEEAMAEIH